MKYNFRVKVLIIEDEVKLAQSLKRGLEQQGYAVDLIHDGQEGLDQIEICHEEYDLVILDLNLPHRSGFSICESARKAGITIPIMMVTARDSLSEKVLGLDSGADDYIIKPFEFIELTARIRMLLRRPKNICITKLTARGLILDPAARTLVIDKKIIKLTTKEFAILEYLMRNSDKVVSRETLLAHVWDQAFDSFSNVVDVHIANLKKKIDDSNHKTIIESIRGSGYRFKK